MSIKESIIKSKIPDFMRSYPTLVSYLVSVGEFMDDSKEFIEHFKYHADYKNGTNFNIANTLRSEGLELPANNEQIPRILLRDLIHNLIRKGTVDSIVWALRVLKIDFEIHQMWLPNPLELQRGWYKDVRTGIKVRYNETENSYKDYLYGESYVDENGLTYFRGSSYDRLINNQTKYIDQGYFDDDYMESGTLFSEYVLVGYVKFGYVERFRSNTEFQGIPIYGESYPTIQVQDNRVSSTPHFLLRISYPEEPSELTQFLIDSLTLNKNRPTNTRLIVEVV